jgi:hypothetical protein
VTDALFSVPVQGRETDERFTPQWVFDGLGLRFCMDPASPVGGGGLRACRNEAHAP